MKTLVPTSILLYYDYPQVFVGRDIVGTRFLAMAVEEQAEEVVYCCTPISDLRLQQVIAGKVDLRTVFQSPEIDEFFVTQDKGTGVFSLTEALLQATWLPEDGLFLDGELDEVFESALIQRSPVAFISLAVPESRDTPRIHSNTLGEFLGLYQNALRHLARYAAKLEGKRLRRDDDPFGTDVIGFSFGSFTVQIRGSHEADLLGESPHLQAAFGLMNVFLDKIGSHEALLSWLQDARGHTASSLIKLLKFSQDRQCSLVHRWAKPSGYTSYTSHLDKDEAGLAYSLCQRMEDLAKENVVLDGYVERASEEQGTWRLFNEDNGRFYSGGIEADSHISMNGITLGNSKRYRFHCHETIELSQGTGKEYRQLAVYRIDETVF